MSQYKHILMLLATAVLLAGCEREAVDESPLFHVIRGSLGTSTRVSLENDPEDPLSYHSVWKGFEQIDVFYKYDGEYFGDPPRVPIEGVTADGRGATFRYQVPREWQKSGAEQYDVKCFTTISKATVAEDGNLYYNASLHRESMDSYVFTVYCEGTVVNGVLNATFHHYYTYELLHISNTSNSDIEFSLYNFEGTPWYKEKGSLCIDDGSFVVDAPSTKVPMRESPPITIKPGETKIIVSAYIPNGRAISEAKMVAKINGEMIHSVNSLSSDIELEQGHAYHMYAGWDGDELRFWNDGEVSLDVRTLTATIDPQYLSGSFTAAVINPPMSELKTGFRFWKEGAAPEEDVDYFTTPSDGSNFNLELTYDNFVEIANGKPVEGKYFVSAFAIDAKGILHDGNVLEFTIDSGQPEAPVIPQAVDLGLPSGTKWAPYNVGARNSQEVGSFFAWGETVPKYSYDWSTYKHADGTEGTCHDIGQVISGSEYDVARKLWGQNWSMPTVEQVHELIMNCSFIWHSEGGVEGIEFKSRINGASIFMPVSGLRYETNTYDENRCFGWTGTLTEGDLNSANHYMMFYSQETEDASASYGGYSRCYGMTVRPVCVGSEAATPEIVDLGLSVKWASFNLGAAKPEEYGDYYAWGEIEPYYSSLDPLTWKEGKDRGYDWSSYKWCKGSYNTMTKYCDQSFYGYNDFTDNKTVLDPEDDAAHVSLGGKWRMPTDDEWTELREKCTWTWATQNGVRGKLVTASNGNSIFLPAVAVLCDTRLIYEGDGYYWSSTLRTGYSDSAWIVAFISYRNAVDRVGVYDRYNGFSIRPVYDDSEPKPEINTPEPVDLGLPSGLKWASFNLGATKPEEYGDYYAWGETKPYYTCLDPLVWKEGKDSGYAWSSYKWCEGDWNTMTKYCSDSYYGYDGFTDAKTILDLEDDAAKVTLGGKWRMPTEAEWTELMENCTWTWSTQNGVNGRLVSASNGNSIFLPAAGRRDDTYLDNLGSIGFYWSSSLCSGGSSGAWDVRYNSGSVGWSGNFRYFGLSVRPVYGEPAANPYGNPSDGGDDGPGGGDDGL